MGEWAGGCVSGRAGGWAGRQAGGQAGRQASRQAGSGGGVVGAGVPPPQPPPPPPPHTHPWLWGWRATGPPVLPAGRGSCAARASAPPPPGERPATAQRRGPRSAAAYEEGCVGSVREVGGGGRDRHSPWAPSVAHAACTHTRAQSHAHAHPSSLTPATAPCQRPGLSARASSAACRAKEAPLQRRVGAGGWVGG